MPHTYQVTELGAEYVVRGNYDRVQVTEHKESYPDLTESPVELALFEELSNFQVHRERILYLNRCLY